MSKKSRLSMLLLLGSMVAAMEDFGMPAPTTHSFYTPPIPAVKVEGGHMSAPAEDSCNKKMHFSCGGFWNTCIPSEHVCDGVLDCHNGKDEKDCADSATTDIFPDKDSKTDSPSTAPSPSNPLPTSDEEAEAAPMPAHAEDSCNEDHFSCGGLWKTCIPIEHVCDGVKDCNYGQDEKNCADSVTTDSLPNSEGYLIGGDGQLECDLSEFRCGDGTCISRELVCNYEKDCSDGSDEDGHCHQCWRLECSHFCEESPQGTRCTCPPQMRLAVDERTCEFPSHCQTDGQRCSQLCAHNIEKLDCKCADGYTLEKDDETCSASRKFQQGRLFFSKDGHSVQSIDLFPSRDEATAEPKDLPVQLSPSQWIFSMAFNPTKKLLYLAVNEAHRQSEVLSLSVAENSKPVELTSLLRGHGIKHIAYDWAANNLYYTSDEVGIGVCSAEGKYCKHLISALRHQEGQTAQRYLGLLVHPKRGILIWLEADSQNPGGVVRAAGLDGKKVRGVGGPSAEKLHSISLDYVRDQLYVVEGDGFLVAYDLRTLERHAMGSEMVGTEAMIHFSSHHYLINRTKHMLAKRKTLDMHGEDVRMLSPVEGKLNAGLAIDNALYYDRVETPCYPDVCSHLCILKERASKEAPSAATCLCPDNYEKDPLSGSCVFGREVEGLVHTSSGMFAEMCNRGEVCLSILDCDITRWNNSKTPACDCPAGYSGLYCEIQLPASTMPQASSELLKWILLLSLLLVVLGVVGVAFYCGWKHRPKWILSTHKARDCHVSPFMDEVLVMSEGSSTYVSTDSGLMRIGGGAEQAFELRAAFPNPHCGGHI